MAITYPLTLPSQGFASLKWRPRAAVAASESPFSFAQQVQAYSGQRWEGSVAWPPLKGETAREITAFVTKLNGKEGTFLMGHPGAETPLGSASSTPGTPVVNGASQTGDELVIDGCPASATGYLLAGDYIQLGTGTSSRLYQVVDDVNTDAGGNATLTIWPDLRTSPSDDDTVVVSDAKGLFRLADNNATWSLKNILYDGISINVVEAL